jgi:hypothetical protein
MYASVADDVPGGFWAENGFDEPRKFYSHSEHRRALKERGLTINAKWAGEFDRHLKRWDVPSRKSLEDARILLSRGKPSAVADKCRQKHTDPDITLTRGVSEDTFRVKAEA